MAHVYRLAGHQMPLVERAIALVKDPVGRHAADVDTSARFPAESIEALGREGLLGLCVPAEYGGAGESVRVFAAVTEELAQACASTAMVYVMHVVATQAIVNTTMLGRKEDVLREIAAGRHLSTLAFSERGSRSQFWAPVSQLVERNGGFAVSAEKSWVTSARHADSYVTSALSPGAQSPLQSTLFLLWRANGAGRVVGAFDGLGLRGNDSAPVVLDDVAVGRDDLLTPLDGGAEAMVTVVLPWFNLGTAAMANGLCRAACGATAQHLRSAGFAHTGTALRDLATLRARLAEMSVRTEQARALLGYALDEFERPSEATPLLVLQTRLASLEAAVDVTDLAMKACGGAAFSRGLTVERLFRDARAGWVMAPTVDHLQEFVGRALTGLPLF